MMVTPNQMLITASMMSVHAAINAGLSGGLHYGTSLGVTSKARET